MAAKETSSSPNKCVGHLRNQYYAVFAANLIVFSHGCLVSWVAPILPLLKSTDTPLTTGPLSLEELSWIVSIGALGSMIAALPVRSLTNRIGCKRLMTTYLAILSIICWSLLAFGRTKYEILIARLLCGGIGAGNDSAILLFATEIADNRIRGALGSMALFVRSTGYMVAIIVGTYVDYSTVPFLFIGLPVVFFAIFLCLPNTAPYLIRTGKLEEAKKSIRFYKGYTGESAETMNALNFEYERLLANNIQHTKKTESITLQKLQKPAVYKGIMIGITLTLLNQYCGCFTLIVYSVGIFQESNSKIDPHVSSIILGALQVAGTLSSTSLVETLGRKLLLVTSMAGCTIGLSTMATYMYLSSLGYNLIIFNWIPVVSLGFVVFISSVGIVSLTYLCIVESLPTEARSFGLAVSIVTLNGFSFISSKLFPILSELIQLHGCIMIYAIICAFGTIFVAMVIKETKGKSLDDTDDGK